MRNRITECLLLAGSLTCAAAFGELVEGPRCLSPAERVLARLTHDPPGREGEPAFVFADLRSIGSAPAGLVPRIDLDRDLGSSHETLRSSRFVLRYPQEIQASYALRVLSVLGSELRRLRVWIPDAGTRRRPLEVLLYPAEVFEEAYGAAVIGIYDGRIRIPILTSEGRTGIVTSSLTHELVHALVAEHTGNGVPYWFQEGLAQYLELDHRISYPVPAVLLAESQPVSLTFLDVVLAGPAEPDLVDRAYRESVWVVHYIGERYGISGIRRLLRAFADRHDAEAALRQAFGTSKADFEEQLWSWCVEVAPRPPRPDVTLAANRSVPGKSRRPDHWAERMYSWHGAYQARVRPAKLSLRTIVAAIREDNAGPPAAACRQLAEDLDLLFSDSRAFDCPNWAVRDPLVEAFYHFEDLAYSCQAGHRGRMWADLDAAEQALQVTAALLGPYGLEP